MEEFRVRIQSIICHSISFFICLFFFTHIHIIYQHRMTLKLPTHTRTHRPPSPTEEWSENFSIMFLSLTLVNEFFRLLLSVFLLPSTACGLSQSLQHSRSLESVLHKMKLFSRICSCATIYSVTPEQTKNYLHFSRLWSTHGISVAEC